MARFYGKIGFEIEQQETEPGIYEPASMIEKPYFGTYVRNTRRWESSSEGINNDLKLNTQISILCDVYMTEHWPAIKYAQINGVNWKVDSIEIKRPRVLLMLGGEWNGHKD